MRKRYNILYTIFLLGLLLGIKNGYIALWKDGSAEPLYVFPYKAQMLPEEDQRKLAQGVPVQDMRALESILEDYLS